VTPLWYRNPGSRYARLVLAYTLGLPEETDEVRFSSTLKAWQQRNGVPQTGVVDDATAQAIGDQRIPWYVAERLETLDVPTQEVRRFQAEQGKPPTGIPDGADKVALVLMGF